MGKGCLVVQPSVFILTTLVRRKTIWMGRCMGLWMFSLSAGLSFLPVREEVSLHPWFLSCGHWPDPCASRRLTQLGLQLPASMRGILITGGRGLSVTSSWA